MLIEISKSQNNKYEISILSYNCRLKSNSIISNETSALLSEVIDDIFSINWGKLRALARPNECEFDDQPDDSIGVFLNYDTFINTGLEYKYLLNDNVLKISYELLKNNFPTFYEKDWHKFYNGFILMETVNYFENINSLQDKKNIFYKMFPKKSICCPYKNKLSEPKSAIEHYVFSSNLEMLVYDIFEPLLQNQNNDFYYHKLNGLCNEILTITKFMQLDCRRFSETGIANLYFLEKKEEIDMKLTSIYNGFELSTPLHKNQSIFQQLSKDKLNKLNLLFNLLYDEKMWNFFNAEYYSNNIGLTRILITELINAELVHRKEITNFIYNCYQKYEIINDNLFCINSETNMAIFLFSYASCFTKLSFPICDICGNHFVRVGNKNRQKQCNTCITNLNKFDDFVRLQKEVSDIEIHVGKIKVDLEYYLENDENKYYKALTEFIGDDKDFKTNNKPIKTNRSFRLYINGLYCDLITLYKDYTKYMLKQVSKEYMIKHNNFVTMFEYDIHNLPFNKDYRNSSFIQHGDNGFYLNLYFKDFFYEHLNLDGFFSTFIQLNEAAAECRDLVRYTVEKEDTAQAILDKAKNAIEHFILGLEIIEDSFSSCNFEYSKENNGINKNIAELKIEFSELLNCYYKKHFSNLETSIETIAIAREYKNKN